MGMVMSFRALLAFNLALLIGNSVHAASIEYFPLLPLVNYQEKIMLLSGDGSTVITRTETDFIKITRQAGVQSLSDLATLCQFPGSLAGISADGQVFAGSCQLRESGNIRYFRHSPQGIELYPEGSFITNLANNPDWAVGAALTPQGQYKAARFQGLNTIEYLDVQEPTDYSEAQAISSDGQWASGVFYTPTAAKVFIQDAANTWILDSPSRITGVSSVGPSVIGVTEESFSGGQAFIYSPLEHYELQLLQNVSNSDFSVPAGISSDGNRIVGTSYSPNFSLNRTHAVLWDRSGIPSLLKDKLLEQGIDTADYYLIQAFGLSDNGRSIAGFAFSRSLEPFVYLASLDSDCPTDFNEDGGIDGADVESFFYAWAMGETAADFNKDGGVDGSDVESFFDSWTAGQCHP